MGELEPFEYRHDGVALNGALALPEGSGPHPGVLVMHNAHGLGPHPKERALRLAKAGYVALCSDMYGEGRYFADPRECAPVMMPLIADPPRFRARAFAGLEALRALPQVDPARLGAIGFCFGGQCVLELARGGADLAAAVSFHGLLKTALPAEPGAVKARVLVLTGAKDPYAPRADVAALEAELAAAGADWQVTTYGEGWHAFSDPNLESEDTPGVRYDPLIDRLSWAQAMAFLEATVRG